MNACSFQLSVEELLATSREISGVDIVDSDVIEPLDVLHQALSMEQAQLDGEGVRAFERKFLRLLANRLRMKRDLHRHPEIAEEKIRGPVIVTGMARSGTTKLQKALASSGDFNFFTFWQSYNWASLSGEPNEPVDPRIADADAFCRWFDTRSPEAKLGHPFEALEPEEDGPLSEGCFTTPTLAGYAEVPTYRRWLADQAPTTRFEFHRDVMKYMQWQGLASGDRTWLLKSPSYSSQELAILDVFPDARFVMAHRSPVATVPSMCKLVGHLRKAYGRSKPDPIQALERTASSMNVHRDIRRANPELPLLDVLFEDVVGDLAAVVARIYAHAGMAQSDTARDNMLRWDAENAMHKLGRFTYTLEEFGLDEALVRDQMRNYFALLEEVEGRGGR